MLIGCCRVNNTSKVVKKNAAVFSVCCTFAMGIFVTITIILCSATTPAIKNIIHNTLENHCCTIEGSVINDLVNNVCQLNPIRVALSEEGPFGTAYQWHKYLKEQFSIVEPVEYILDAKQGRSFQYRSILHSLSQVLKSSEIQENLLKSARRVQEWVYK